MHPGYAARIMAPSEAVQRAACELDSRPNLHIVAVAGPGDALASPATLEVFDKVRHLRPHVEFCLSTNGFLLSEMASRLVGLGVKTVTVSMSTALSSTADRIYEWAMLDGVRTLAPELGKRVVPLQLQGIEDASALGIHVRVNSVLIPGVNDSEMSMLSRAVAEAGAQLQNIIPLVPNANMSSYRPPTPMELEQARSNAMVHIGQFRNCRQCRSDVVGIPGMDVPL
jgi:nitrogen fixation protein NifB